MKKPVMTPAPRSVAMIRKAARREALIKDAAARLADERSARRQLLEGMLDRSLEAMVWHVAITGAHAEKAVEQELRGLGLSAFFPREIVSIGQRQRRLEVERALFPRYVLFAGARRAALDVRSIRSLVGVLSTSEGLYRCVPPGQVIALVRAEHAGLFNRSDKAGYRRPKVGDGITITSGPLTGWPATVLSVTSGDRITCLMTMLGVERRVSVRLDSLSIRD